MQVLDKGVHKLFKQWSTIQRETKPTQLDVAQWIQRSWDQVQYSTILNTWQSIAIHPYNNN
jgi:hypothetical protein